MTPKYIKTLNHQRIADLLSHLLPSKGNQTNTSPAYSDREFQAIISRAVHLLRDFPLPPYEMGKEEYGIARKGPNDRKWKGPYPATSYKDAKESVITHNIVFSPTHKFKIIKRTVGKWKDADTLKPIPLSPLF